MVWCSVKKSTGSTLAFTNTLKCLINENEKLWVGGVGNRNAPLYSKVEKLFHCSCEREEAVWDRYCDKDKRSMIQIALD
jgi:hypothetical protein